MSSLRAAGGWVMACVRRAMQFSAAFFIYDEPAAMRASLRHVLVRHEQGAVHMADRERPNAVTGIANAFL